MPCQNVSAQEFWNIVSETFVIEKDTQAVYPWAFVEKNKCFVWDKFYFYTFIPSGYIQLSLYESFIMEHRDTASSTKY